MTHHPELNRRDLDRYITGNWGEDQHMDNEERELLACQECGAVLDRPPEHQWYELFVCDVCYRGHHKRERLTVAQEAALVRIRQIRDIKIRHMEQAIASDEHLAGCKPSEWVFLADLRSINRATLNALVKKGYLLKRPTDGFGPEVKIVEGKP